MIKPVGKWRMFAMAAMFSAVVVQAEDRWLSVDPASPVAEDIPYRSALFYQHAGDYEKVLSVLAAADRSAASASVNAYRDMLAANAGMQLGHYQEVERTLSGLQDPQLFPDYNTQILYPLAMAYYGQKRCDKALETIARAQGFAPEVSAHIMNIRVTCMTSRSTDAAVISQAENVINDALMTKLDADNMWFAYAYYNVASAAARFKYYTDAERQFNEALRYIDGSAEGRALKERTLLNLGQVNYADNRFDYASKYFAQMPVDGIWADVSLLAYGWASVNSYKPDMAIEAWRQLINLPYKSMSVYEGYMAIPVAFEKASSFAEALESYDNAINEFMKVESEINQLVKTLSLQQVHTYALAYGHDNEDAAISTLPPLLARIYTEDHLRAMVELINDVEAHKQRLADYDRSLQKNRNQGDEQLVSLQKRVAVLQAHSEKVLTAIETSLLEQTVAILEQQKKVIMQYTLDARITNARLQEEFFQRGGRRLWR